MAARAGLLNYAHQPADTPYRTSHAIFIREGAQTPYSALALVPDAPCRRTISLRAFDDRGQMVDADLVDGRELEALIERLFSNPEAAYLIAHCAKRGCYAARIRRA